MKKLLLCLCALLSACGSTPRTPEPIIQTVEVKVPVREPCKAPDIAMPSYPFDSAKVEMALDDKTKLLLAERLVREDTLSFWVPEIREAVINSFSFKGFAW